MAAPMTPREVVQELDKYIISQNRAKKMVAIALRNRFRREQVKLKNKELSNEIVPKNILMIGPTGVGKTEIARRLAKLAKAPFIKVEATKFTEVGYVGRDVDAIIRDLVDVAVKETREEALQKVRHRASEVAEERILNALVPPPREPFAAPDQKPEEGVARQVFRKKLREGELQDTEVEIDISVMPMGVEIMGPQGMEELTSQLQNIFHNLGSEKKRTRKMKVKDALRILREEEANKMINEEEIKTKALQSVEQNGIVFIDEFDKITRRTEGMSGADVSREGVQRDLLPIVEGSTVVTKYGSVQTDHILFIAAGAFHLAKPSDLIPELQGRFPIRVELEPLTVEDFIRIFTETNASLATQSVELLSTEGVQLEFTKDGVKRIAEVAFQVNERTENIGARRLYTVVERVLETISFEASERSGETVIIDAKYVDDHLGELLQNEDLARYIL